MQVFSEQILARKGGNAGADQLLRFRALRKLIGGGFNHFCRHGIDIGRSAHIHQAGAGFVRADMLHNHIHRHGNAHVLFAIQIGDSGQIQLIRVLQQPLRNFRNLRQQVGA